MTDLRRGVLVKSEDQGEELLSSAIVGQKLLVGGDKGGLRMWGVGVWDDNEETVMVGKGASADVIATAPDRHTAAIGMDDGKVRFIRLSGKRSKVLDEVRHDEIEGVLGLGFEIGGRMISGGGSVVKIWEESRQTTNGIDEENGSKDRADTKRAELSDGEDNDSDGREEKSSEEEEEKPRKRKKRKKNKANGKSGTQHIIAFKGMD